MQVVSSRSRLFVCGSVWWIEDDKRSARRQRDGWVEMEYQASGLLSVVAPIEMFVLKPVSASVCHVGVTQRICK